MKYEKYVTGALVTAVVAAAAIVLPFSANAQTANVNASVGASIGTNGINPGGPMMPASQGQGQGGHWGGRGGGGGMASSTWKGPAGTGAGMMGARPAVVGKVTAISGDTLTVVAMAHPGFGSSTPAAGTTTYTVNANAATVIKNNATSSVSAISVGDLVAVQGTVSGTSVTATSIRDGVEMRMGPTGGAGGQNGFQHWNNASSSNNMPSPIAGNGQPVIAGTISAINGNSLTITNKSNVTYTVDVTNAKIVEGQNTVTASSLSVGDNVIIQGSVSGSSVTASSVIDQKAAGGQGSTTSGQPGHSGIFGAIGGFFSKLFGF